MKMINGVAYQLELSQGCHRFVMSQLECYLGLDKISTAYEEEPVVIIDF